jgi:RNA recognition motif-containing protein
MNIYVGNLSLETTEDELRQTFATYGEVTSVTMMNDKYIGSGQINSYGYVEMTSKSAGIAAIAGLARKRVRDRFIRVIEALPLSDRNGKRWSSLRKTARPSRSRQRYSRVI